MNFEIKKTGWGIIKFKIQEIIFISLILLITLSCLFAISAKDIYVASDGADDLNGTDLDNPCSFNKAISISEDGDNIKMKAGDYSISGKINCSLTPNV